MEVTEKVKALHTQNNKSTKVQKNNHKEQTTRKNKKGTTLNQ